MKRADGAPGGRGREPVRIGVSTCLLGEEVRFDGGHKRDAYLTGILDRYFEWVPVCPEVDIGLGVPRESLRLVGDAAAPRLVTTKTGRDHTERMLAYAQAKVEELRPLGLDGYILKSKSPSCGLERVRVYTPEGMPSASGGGLFARVLLERLSTLPVEEEGRLNDLRIRENFIVRVFSHHRWRQLRQGPFRVRDLVAFHARHKLLLLAHSERAMRSLGKLVAAAKAHRPKDLLDRYGALFFEALRSRPTTRRHTNVLQHMAGHLRSRLDEHDRGALHATIEDYRQGLVPLVVPLTLLNHHVRKFQVEYLRDQVYLNPHPKELMLLNHV